MWVNARQLIRDDLYQEEFIFIRNWPDGYAILMKESHNEAIILFNGLTQITADDLVSRIKKALNRYVNES